MKSPYVIDHVSRVVVLCGSGTTTRSTPGKGSGSSSTDWTTLKIAVVELIPSARVTTAAAVKAVLFRSARTAYTRSWAIPDIWSSDGYEGVGMCCVRARRAASSRVHSIARETARSAMVRCQTRNRDSPDRAASAKRSRQKSAIAAPYRSAKSRGKRRIIARTSRFMRDLAQ